MKKWCKIEKKKVSCRSFNTVIFCDTLSARGSFEDTIKKEKERRGKCCCERKQNNNEQT